MRLSEVLSKTHDSNDYQVEGFLGKTKTSVGKSKKIKVGKVARNYFCLKCNENRTYLSRDELTCVIVDEHMISIDCVLRCSVCNAPIELWFLVGCTDSVFSLAPDVYLVQCTERLDEIASHEKGDLEFSDLLEKAELAHSSHLGAGSVIYLRKIFEKVTFQAAHASGINIETHNHGHRPFRQILEDVDAQHPIMPSEFSRNGYRLFGDLSDVIHGDFDEEEALSKYESFRRLVIGILENIKNSEELSQAIRSLGWSSDETRSTMTGATS